MFRFEALSRLAVMAPGPPDVFVFLPINMQYGPLLNRIMRA